VRSRFGPFLFIVGLSVVLFGGPDHGVNGFTILGAAAWVTPVFNGAALLLSVAASTLLQRSRENRARKAVFRAMQNEAAPSGPIDVR